MVDDRGPQPWDVPPGGKRAITRGPLTYTADAGAHRLAFEGQIKNSRLSCVMGGLVSGRRFGAGRGRWVVGRHAARIVVVGFLLAVGSPGSAAAATGWTAYVANEAGVSVTPIDTATNTAGPAIPVGTDPQAVAITPDGQTAYVTNFASGTVTPIDTALDTTGGKAIPVGTDPKAVAITPDGRTAYVANYAGDTVTPIDIATNKPGMAIPVGTAPKAVAITPDGRTAYVTSFYDVTPINIATNTPGTTISVGTAPDAVAITPDGKTAYVANFGDDTVSPIDIATNKPGTAIPVGTDPYAVAITPDGKTAYVANAGDNTVTPIDIATNKPGTAIPVGTGPYAVAITPDGKTAYVTNFGSDSVTPIDIATNKPGMAIPVGSGPGAVAIVPDQAPLASFSVVAGTAGSASAFDASGSASAVGGIVSYQWSFGDGQTARTTLPQTSHVYARAGSYTATLTVTDSAGTSLGQVFTGQTASNNGGPAAMTSHTVTVTPPPVPPQSTVPPVPPQSTTARFGNQQITLLIPSQQRCTAASKALAVTLASTAISTSRATKLKFSSAAFYIGKGVKHTTKKTEHLKHAKTKKVTITTYKPNATVHHVPAVLALKLTDLKTSTQTLKVVVSYKKTVTKHSHQATKTVTKTLTTKFKIC
jgi:YVTN family beta-propeller protein